MYTYCDLYSYDDIRTFMYTGAWLVCIHGCVYVYTHVTICIHVRLWIDMQLHTLLHTQHHIDTRARGWYTFIHCYVSMWRAALIDTKCLFDVLDWCIAFMSRASCIDSRVCVCGVHMWRTWNIVTCLEHVSRAYGLLFICITWRAYAFPFICIVRRMHSYSFTCHICIHIHVYPMRYAFIWICHVHMLHAFIVSHMSRVSCIYHMLNMYMVTFSCLKTTCTFLLACTHLCMWSCSIHLTCICHVLSQKVICHVLHAWYLILTWMHISYNTYECERIYDMWIWTWIYMYEWICDEVKGAS